MIIILSTETSNLANFISWRRLAQELHSSGEIKINEHVVRFEVDERGINYFVVED